MFSLRAGGEAGRRTEQLLKILPDDLNALDLRAQWLRDQKRAAEIEPLVEGRMQKVLARLDKGSTAGGKPRPGRRRSLPAGRTLCGGRAMVPEAAKAGGEIYGPLAISIAKQGRIQEAVALCKRRPRPTIPPSPATAIGRNYHNRAGHAGRSGEGGGALPEESREKHEDQPALRGLLGSIYVLLDQPEQAIEQYREILKLQPKNAATLSDLATVLAEQPNDESRKEALELRRARIELAGPQPVLLDTKGMALFYDGKLERAELALQTAAQSPNPDPRYCFHYAVVCANWAISTGSIGPQAGRTTAIWNISCSPQKTVNC